MGSLRCARIWKWWRSDKRSVAQLSISFDHNTCTGHVEYHSVHDAHTHPHAHAHPCTLTLNFLLYNCLGFCDGRKLKCGSFSGKHCSRECESCDPGVACVASSPWATDSMFNWAVTLKMMKGSEQQKDLQSICETYSSTFESLKSFSLFVLLEWLSSSEQDSW